MFVGLVRFQIQTDRNQREFREEEKSTYSFQWEQSKIKYVRHEEE